MKIKKFLLATVAALGLATATGLNHNVVKADPTTVQTAAPDKNEIIRKIEQNPLKSGRIELNLRLKTDEVSSKHKHRSVVLGFKDVITIGHKGKVIHDVIRLGKHSKIQFWATPKTVYVKESKKWQKFPTSKKVRGETSQELKLGMARLVFRQKLYDAMKLSDNGSSYVLTLANNPKLNRQLLQMALKSEKMSKKDRKEANKELKIDHYTCRAVYDKNSYQLLGAEVHLSMRKIGLKVTETVSNVNAYHNLRIPRAVIKHAKKLK